MTDRIIRGKQIGPDIAPLDMASFVRREVRCAMDLYFDLLPDKIQSKMAEKELQNELQGAPDPQVENPNFWESIIDPDDCAISLANDWMRLLEKCRDNEGHLDHDTILQKLPILFSAYDRSDVGLLGYFIDKAYELISQHYKFAEEFCEVLPFDDIFKEEEGNVIDMTMNRVRAMQYKIKPKVNKLKEMKLTKLNKLLPESE